MRWLFASLLLLAPLLAAAQTYRWVDDNGRTQYSQLPPKDGRQYTVIGPAPPPSSAPNQDSLNRALGESAKAAPAARDAAAAAASDAAAREQQCRQAMSDLAYIDATPARRMMRTDESGTPSRVTEQEHARRRAEIEKRVNETCS